MIKSWCWLIHPERAIIMNRTGLSTLAMSSVHYRQTSDVRPRCDEKSTRSSFRSIRDSEAPLLSWADSRDAHAMEGSRGSREALYFQGIFVDTSVNDPRVRVSAQSQSGHYQFKIFVARDAIRTR